MFFIRFHVLELCDHTFATDLENVLLNIKAKKSMEILVFTLGFALVVVRALGMDKQFADSNE